MWYQKHNAQKKKNDKLDFLELKTSAFWKTLFRELKDKP